MAFQPVFGKPFPNAFPTASSGDWWNLFGAIPKSACVAAYRPKGAASLAASYVNLANPGTYNAAPGTAPTWDATNGWKFAAASSQYLNTGVYPGAQSWSMFVRYSNATITGGIIAVLCGMLDEAPSWTRFWLGYSATNYAWANTALKTGSPFETSGNMGFSATTAYLNGAAVSGAIGTDQTNYGFSIYIGGRNYEGTPGNHISAYVQALWIANITLNSTQVSALNTYMGAL